MACRLAPISLLALCTLASACARQRPLTVTVAEHPVDEPVRVYLRDRQILRTVARPRGDGGFWLIGPEETPIPTEELVAVDYADWSSGAFIGLGIGAGVGAVGGLMIGIASFDASSCDPDDPDEAFSGLTESMCRGFGPLEDGIIGGLVGLGVGMLLGFVIGGSTGERTIYGERPRWSVTFGPQPRAGGGQLGVVGAF